MLIQAGPTFEMDALTHEVLEQGVNFIGSDIAKFALGVFWILIFFHLFEGALELLETRGQSRLFSPRFYMRIFFTIALLLGYNTLVVGSAQHIMPNYMVSLGTQWGNMFDDQINAAQAVQEKAVQDKQLKDKEIEQKQGEQDQSIGGKIARYVVDGLITGVGYVLAIMSGLVLTCLVLFEGFMVLGVVTLLIAFGPLCVAFLAHERTEGFFWSFFKTWLMYGLLYIPALNLGMTMAGIVFKHMSTFMAGGISVSGDWSDIGIHFVLIFIGPFCAYAMVRSVSTFLAIVFQSGVIGSGHSSFVGGVQGAAQGTGGGSPSTTNAASTAEAYGGSSSGSETRGEVV